jgi:hypothetical protein
MRPTESEDNTMNSKVISGLYGRNAPARIMVGRKAAARKAGKCPTTSGNFAYRCQREGGIPPPLSENLAGRPGLKKMAARSEKIPRQRQSSSWAGAFPILLEKAPFRPIPACQLERRDQQDFWSPSYLARSAPSGQNFPGGLVALVSEVAGPAPAYRHVFFQRSQSGPERFAPAGRLQREGA